MNLFGLLQLSGSALLAERQRGEVVASNLANAESTSTVGGGPYRRKHVIFAAGNSQPDSFAMHLASFGDVRTQGVRVLRVVDDPAPPVRRFDPGHPDADAQGYVSEPAINPVEEMVNLMGSARSYQLNVAAVQATKAMIQASLDIAR